MSTKDAQETVRGKTANEGKNEAGRRGSLGASWERPHCEVTTEYRSEVGKGAHTANIHAKHSRWGKQAAQRPEAGECLELGNQQGVGEGEGPGVWECLALTRGRRDKSLGYSEWRGSLCLRFQQDPHTFRV